MKNKTKKTKSEYVHCSKHTFEGDSLLVSVRCCTVSVPLRKCVYNVVAAGFFGAYELLK